MRYEFCTLFDANYLPRGLVLHRSLEQHCADFRLRVYTMDDESERVLAALALPHLEVVPLAALEAHDPGLCGVKGDRTAVEYCWTATPAICLHALETDPELESITYLDADLMFFHDPLPLFEEMNGASTMIVPHRYAPRYRGAEATSGAYNVEWLTFRRDEHGLAALTWWHDRCIEWCYFRYEDGKMGDQKYLDDWPDRFESVHVLRHPGGGLAPWNAEQYTLEERDGQVLVDRRELVFYHYHSLRLYDWSPLARLASRLRDTPRGGASLAWTALYPASPVERRLVWEPYLERLHEERERVRAVAPHLAAGVGRWSVRDEFSVARLRAFAGTRARRVADRLRGLDPWARRRYRESWKSAAVAGQMRELAERELADPAAVAPFASFLAAMEELLVADGLPRPARFLDVGCGVGAYGDLLERYFPGRFDYVGVDYADEILAAARERAPDRIFEHRDLVLDGIPPGYDVVLASALVDVLADWERALDGLFAADARYVVLHRQRVARGRSRVALVAGYQGQRTYASFVTLADLERIASRHRRRIVATVPVAGEMSTFVLAREPAA